MDEVASRKAGVDIEEASNRKGCRARRGHADTKKTANSEADRQAKANRLKQSED